MTTEPPENDHDFVVRADGNAVAASGELDADTAPRLAEVLGGLDGDVSLNMAGIGFIDSSGLRVLIDTESRLAETDAHLTIVSPSPQVDRVLQLASLDTYLTIER